VRKTDKIASHTGNSYEMDELLMYRPPFRDYTGPMFLVFNEILRTCCPYIYCILNSFAITLVLYNFVIVRLCFLQILATSVFLVICLVLSCLISVRYKQSCHVICQTINLLVSLALLSVIIIIIII